MHREALTGLLADLFAAHGFDVTQDAALEGRSGTVYGAPVLAETRDRVLLVERRGPDKTIETDLVDELRRVVDDTGADGALLVHLGRRTPAAEAAAARDRVVLWDEATLIRCLGEMHVFTSTGRTPPSLPLDAAGPGRGPQVAATLEELLPPSFRAPEEVAFADGAFDILDVSDEPTPTAAPTTPLAGVPNPTPATAPAAPAASAPRSGLAHGVTTLFPVLAARIDAQRAAATVQDRLFAVADKAQIVLQPVHLLDYACDLLLEGSLQYDTVQGRIEVHGTTKAVREVDASFIDPGMVAPPPVAKVALEEKTLRVSDARAQEKAHAAILDAHTRVVQIETHDEDEDFSIIEQKRVAPRPDQVRLAPLGTFYRPLWRLRGPNGSVLVDAITGAVEEESLRSPNPDTLILD